MQFRRPRNRHDPGLLSEHPGKCDLSNRCLLALSDCLQQIHQRPVRLPSLRRETRYSVAKIVAVKIRVLVDLAREKSLTQRAERNKADPELFESRHNFRFRL